MTTAWPAAPPRPSADHRQAVLAWLLDLITGAPEPVGDISGRERFEAIEITFRGERFLVRVDEDRR